MDPAEARSILRLHRPGRDRETDPLVASALDLARKDPELSRWLDAEEELDTVLTARLEEALPVPAELRESLLAAPWRAGIEEHGEVIPEPETASLSEPRQSSRAASPRRSWWWRALTGAALGATATFLVTSGLRLPVGAPTPVPRAGTVAPSSLSEFRSEMVAFVRLPPSLELTTRDPQQMRDYLRGHENMVDVLIPTGLEKLPGAGCRTLRFRGRPVALMCFQPPGGGLTHLLVVDRGILPTTGTRTAPEMVPEGDWLTAAWTQGTYTYLLCAKADGPPVQDYLAGL